RGHERLGEQSKLRAVARHLGSDVRELAQRRVAVEDDGLDLRARDAGPTIHHQAVATTSSPTAISPSVRMSALRPPRLARPLITPGLVMLSRCLHGWQSSTPTHSTAPTRKRLPTSEFTSIPRVRTLRRGHP